MTAADLQQSLALALGYYQSDRLADAAALCQSILQHDPRQPDALHLAGIIALRQGDAPAAVDLLRRAAAARPGVADFHNNLGLALLAVDQPAAALASFDAAIRLHPERPETHHNRGNALRALGRFDDALAALTTAEQLRPGNALVHTNLGNTCRDLGRTAEALRWYESAVRIAPGLAVAHYNLAVALLGEGQRDRALGEFRFAVTLQPTLAEAHFHLGNLLWELARPIEAEAAYRAAIQARPAYTQAWYNLGLTLSKLRRYDHAADAYREALRIHGTAIGAAPTPPAPSSADPAAARGRVDAGILRAAQEPFDPIAALNNLANALLDQGEVDDAIATVRRAVALEPAYAVPHSNLVYMLHLHPDYTAEAIYREHEVWRQHHADPLAHLIRPHTNDRDPERRLRVGYVSPDFRDHAVGRNLVPLFEHHDHKQFEIFCYADQIVTDRITERFRAAADHWVDTTRLDDQPLADRVRADRVDILVDLTLHLAFNRLLLFARKPAPLQATFAGYPSTTGLTTIDYRITDVHLDPPAEAPAQRIYSEELARLPDCFWCFDPLGDSPPVNPPPALHSDVVTFGSFNSFVKMNPPLLRLWARVLHAAPRSRLLLLATPGSHRAHTLSLFSSEGIDPARIGFVTPQPRPQYLAAYNQLDIALDTLPYGGHTTSCDALWMGVPVITQTGRTAVGRGAASILANAGLPDLIASSNDDYIRLAAGLAADLPRLATLRSTMRDRLRASPLMDAPRFARNIESLYRAIWRRLCAGQPATAI